MLAFKAVKLNQKHTKVYIAKMFMNFIVAKAFAPKLFFCCLPTDRALRWQFCHHTPKKQCEKATTTKKPFQCGHHPAYRWTVVCIGLNFHCPPSLFSPPRISTDISPISTEVNGVRAAGKVLLLATDRRTDILKQTTSPRSLRFCSEPHCVWLKRLLSEALTSSLKGALPSNKADRCEYFFFYLTEAFVGVN